MNYKTECSNAFRFFFGVKKIKIIFSCVEYESVCIQAALFTKIK